MTERWHGTDGGYNNHRCRCPDCKAAHTAYRNANIPKARARAAADPGLVTHGKFSGYTYWGCRCPACKEARKLAGRRYRAAAASP